MNKLIYIPVFAVIMTACSDNSKQVQQLQALHTQDSLLTRQPSKRILLLKTMLKHWMRYRII